MVAFWCCEVEQVDFLPRGSASFCADQSFRAHRMALKYSNIAKTPCFSTFLTKSSQLKMGAPKVT
jgi:hypothetical protein